MTLALVSAAATSATLLVAADLIGVLLQTAGDATDMMLDHIALLWPAGFGVALVHAVALGLPAYLALNRLKLTRWWVSLIGGFAVGSLPYAVLALPWSAPPPELVGAHIIPRFTWLHYAGVVGGLGLLGMAGGFAAWLTWAGLGWKFAKRHAAVD